jgi:peptide/nickel transport system permease protein
VSLSASLESARRYQLPTRLRRNRLIGGALGSTSGRIGVGLLALIVAIALLGPLLAPYGATEIVGPPFQKPSSAHLLGTDGLGRDALSRFLDGGRTLLTIALASAVLATTVGVLLGMLAGYRGGALDLSTIAVSDLIVAFPPIVFVLLLVAGAGTGLLVVTLAIAVVNMPRIFRLVRTATLEVSTQEFVEAAFARGEPPSSILRRDILPNIWTLVLADFGLRVAGCVILFSSLSYLGLGQAPPAADWGLIIGENRAALLVQPWVVIAPALAIALLTVSVNLVADAIARSIGRSVLASDV